MGTNCKNCIKVHVSVFYILHDLFKYITDDADSVAVIPVTRVDRHPESLASEAKSPTRTV